MDSSFPIDRRRLLQRSAMGMGSLALSAMLGQESAANAPSDRSIAPLAPRGPHFQPKAKRVIPNRFSTKTMAKSCLAPTCRPKEKPVPLLVPPSNSPSTGNPASRLANYSPM